VFGAHAVGTYCNHPGAGLRHLDMRDGAAVQRCVSEVRPDVILQPAAQPHVDWCEEHVQESHDVNVAGTRHVVNAARAVGARYVFFSTDYLFNGRSGPHPEDAAPDPLNVYGRHKLEAETIIRTSLEDSLIVRVCGVYGFERQGKNFIMALLARGGCGEPMNVPSDQWGNPTYADNLAAAVKELALATHRGVVHVAGPDYLDRMAFARLACSVFGLDATFLHPRPTAEFGQRAPRPLRGGLDTAKARRILTTPLAGPQQGLALMREQLRAQGMLP
jgi:dTDP-4-dehydrorhamnose reductase